jgi:hypothetical protein
VCSLQLGHVKVPRLGQPLLHHVGMELEPVNYLLLAKSLGLQFAHLDQYSHLPGQHGEQVQRGLAGIQQMVQQPQSAVGLAATYAVHQVKDACLAGAADQRPHVLGANRHAAGVE